MNIKKDKLRFKHFNPEQNPDATNEGEYPPPTFTPPSYDDLGEIADDNYLYMSAGRGEPPQFQRVKLFGGNGTKED